MQNSKRQLAMRCVWPFWVVQPAAAFSQGTGAVSGCAGKVQMHLLVNHKHLSRPSASAFYSTCICCFFTYSANHFTESSPSAFVCLVSLVCVLLTSSSDLLV